jgi:hypothetical protein
MYHLRETGLFTYQSPFLPYYPYPSLPFYYSSVFIVRCLALSRKIFERIWLTWFPVALAGQGPVSKGEM